jgi:hypothetical protein
MYIKAQKGERERERERACNSTLPNVTLCLPHDQKHLSNTTTSLYSRFDLTKDLYAMLLVCSFFIWRFLLKNPNNFCAFDVMLFMSAFQVILDEMAIPRYFVVSMEFPRNTQKHCQSHYYTKLHTIW